MSISNTHRFAFFRSIAALVVGFSISAALPLTAQEEKAADRAAPGESTAKAVTDEEAPAKDAPVKDAPAEVGKDAEGAEKPAGAVTEGAEKTEGGNEEGKETAEEMPAPVDPDDEAAAEEADAEKAAVAVPVSADPVQVFGWREHIQIQGVVEKLQAKLDTGALTSSIHAEEKELFERDGKKWVRFIVTDPGKKNPQRTRIEAPLVRVARIKEPGGESTPREVVRLSFQIGDRKGRGEFTLNNRVNMLSPVLIGRTTIRELGWVDPGRTYLAEKKIFR